MNESSLKMEFLEDERNDIINLLHVLIGAQVASQGRLVAADRR